MVNVLVQAEWIGHIYPGASLLKLSDMPAGRKVLTNRKGGGVRRKG